MTIKENRHKCESHNFKGLFVATKFFVNDSILFLLFGELAAKHIILEKYNVFC